jgi:disulfide bond formation protein DsbB
MFIIMTVLFFTLVGCAGEVAEKVTPSPTLPQAPVVAEKIAGEAVVLFPIIPTETPVAAEKRVEKATITPVRDGDPVAGEKIFVSACAACHGQDMIHSEFIATKTDRELVDFIAVGGLPDGPPVMPPRGGNPRLTDENLVDIAAYLRSLQK